MLTPFNVYSGLYDGAGVNDSKKNALYFQKQQNFLSTGFGKVTFKKILCLLFLCKLVICSLYHFQGSTHYLNLMEKLYTGIFSAVHTCTIVGLKQPDNFDDILQEKE